MRWDVPMRSSALLSTSGCSIARRKLGSNYVLDGSIISVEQCPSKSLSMWTNILNLASVLSLFSDYAPWSSSSHPTWDQWEIAY
ncbi:hypothetical protein TOPH_08235 [Tolypocladium ophioglossoides CBS 100239]|uniref:Uncharacterized protein n=1 Tax=Tolypocladium ophioglossoides (strain CBS 100239) TaxID=1163406 RepID=A0A0L0MZE2_TOLOC|nr:hypothetical protein TOPH_08235 [Tolypocladium ophioglossoides CBS 100239]